MAPTTITAPRIQNVWLQVMPILPRLGRGLDRLELQTDLTKGPPNYDAAPSRTIKGQVEFRADEHHRPTPAGENYRTAHPTRGVSPAPELASGMDRLAPPELSVEDSAYGQSYAQCADRTA
jgi:hypothetical protein